MPVTTDVTIYDELGNIAMIVPGSALPAARSAVLMGASDGTNGQAVASDAFGRLKSLTLDGSGNSIGSTAGSMNVNITGGSSTATSVVQNITATNTTGSITGAGGTGNVNLTTSNVDQILMLLEVRPSTGTNNFEIKIYSDSGRTKLIYWVDQITLDEWVADEYQALPLPDGIAYVTIVNNAAGTKTFTVSATVEVRS